jgi:serine/threonine protein kinase
VSAEPQKSDPKPPAEDEQDAWEREQEEAERKMLDERVGMLVADRYRIVRTLGAGGMGGVYEAEHELIGKRVALKCLHREYSRDRDLVERFKREARAATAIGNEHIVDVTDMGDLPDGAPFLVMEVLQGQTLSHLIETGGVIRIPRAMHIARQVCDALGAAHAKGIVHRDLKPENIFLIKRGGDSDFVKVLDFGISKMHGGERKDRGLTRTGMAIGTPSYMSPEQAQGLRDVDQRTDIWALGVIIYEMLAGRRPFDADSYPMLLMKIVGAEPERLVKWRKDVPDPLDLIIMRCLEKPVGTRMQTMADLEAGLAKFADVDRPPELVAEELRSPTDRASRTIARGKRGSQADGPPVASDEDEPLRKGTAATQLVGSTPPPAKEASGVRSSQQPGGTEAGASLEPRKGPMTAKDLGRSWPAEDAPPVVTPTVTRPSGEAKAKAESPRTAEIGAVVRGGQARTGEIGTITRGREATDPGHGTSGGDVVLPGRSNTPMIAIGAIVLVLIVGGIGWAAGGGLGGSGSTESPAPIAAAPPVPVADPPAIPHADPPPVAPAAPTEVRVRIQVMPIDARITIDDVEFPNPMDALQTRRLTPTRIRAEREGYRTLEQLVIFDSDQNFHFELARGGGVQHVGLGGTSEGHAPTEPTAPHDPPPSHGHDETPPTGSGDGFRDQF